MKIVIYSDLQIHNYKTFSTTDSNYVNSRLQDHINCLNEVLDYCVENHIDTLVNNGDLIDQRNMVEVSVIDAVMDFKQRVNDKDIYQLDNNGNHCLANRSSLISSLDIFKHIDKQIIFKKPCWHRLPDRTGILFIPYMNKIEEVLEGIKLTRPPGIGSYIVLVHYGLTGVDLGHNVVIEDPENLTEGFIKIDDLADLVADVDCKKILFGHIHLSQKITDKIEFIGTLLAHNWNEKNINCRFIEVDTLTGNIKSMYPSYPKFIEFEELSDVKKDKCKNNFCRVYIDEPEHKESIKNKLIEYGARGVDVVLNKKVPKLTSKLNLNLGMSFTEMGKKMLSNDDLNGLDKDKLELILKTALDAVINE